MFLLKDIDDYEDDIWVFDIYFIIYRYFVYSVIFFYIEKMLICLDDKCIVCFKIKYVMFLYEFMIIL